MDISKLKSQDSNPIFSRLLLFAAIIILALVVGILATMLFYQKKETSNSAKQLQPNIPSISGQNPEQTQNQSQVGQENFLGFNAIVKNKEGNKITLTDLPNFLNKKDAKRELVVVVSKRTELTKYIMPEQSTAITGEPPEGSASIEDIKEKYFIDVELFEAVDLENPPAEVEAKKIRIEGGPGYQ